MTKYLNMLVFSALAMFIASPASAEIINLYDLENFLYYGSTNLGEGIEGGDDPYVPSCDASQGEFDSPPSNMTCQSFNKGSITCYRNCSCSSEFKYDDSNCPSAQRFVRSNQTCEGKSKSCSCSDDALDPRYVNSLKSAFNGIDSYASGDGSVTCHYLTNPSCKVGEQYSYTDVYNAVGSSFSHPDYRALNVPGKDEPIAYDLVASAKTQTSGTVYCLTDAYVISSFSEAVSLSNNFNVNCAKVSMANAKLNGLPYYYLDGSCNTTTDGGLCDIASASATATVSFNFYSPGGKGLRYASCEYVTASTCPTGLGVLEMNYNQAISDFENKDGFVFKIDDIGNNLACVTFVGCESGYTLHPELSGEYMEELFGFDPEVFDQKVRKILDEELSGRTYEYKIARINYSSGDYAGKTAPYLCYKETGCQVPQDDWRVIMACYVDSSLITSIIDAKTLGYTLSSTSACTGVKIKHPLEDKYICIPNTL